MADIGGGRSLLVSPLGEGGVAPTIAGAAAAEVIDATLVAEATQYRPLDRAPGQ